MNTRDTLAFEELFHAYYAPLCFFATKILKDEEAARDVVQEVFIRFWEKELSFENFIAVKACLYTSVQNKALNYLEKRNNRQRIRENMAQESHVEDDFLLLQVEADVFKALFEAVEELPTQCREVFTLSYIEQKDIREIAIRLNIAETTVKTHRRRAKEFLRKRLRPEDLWVLMLFIDDL
ncbi:MAG: RNA polymerase sigma-70 factor [Odoribacteraceae bacterium]|nr:RNA polymerase sigma-70 factor [Odoribacteraceae bacterium]